MNKRRKLLSLILCVGIVTSAFPSLGIGATNDSIAFYNSKKTILDMREYDEAYDTNHDGVVNVFDVIRENKEVFHEESYTDLKSKIYSLESQIEILTQKLAEKEEKTQLDLFEINDTLSGKVDQQDGKQLSSNDYTNEEKQKLESLNNYDDTSIKSDISEISSSLSGKIDNQEGKQLSTNDYTDEDKNKLESLENYNDKDIKAEISSINSELSSINDSISGKVDQQEGKQLSSNDYTNSDKEKLESLVNYDDTKINEKIELLVQTAYEEKKDIVSEINTKVEKVEGKQLSSNDYTDEDKRKLESLYNYDDTDIKNEILNIQTKRMSIIGDSWSTYKGYTNPDENAQWYPAGSEGTEGHDNDVDTPKGTWWYLVSKENGFVLDTNNSYSGSPVCYDGYGDGNTDAKLYSFVSRMKNVGCPDVIFIEGGSNDSSVNADVGEVKYCGWAESDFVSYAPSLCYIFDYYTSRFPNSEIYFLMAEGVKSDYKNISEYICQHYGVKYVLLNGIEYGGEHPSKSGMRTIADIINDAINQ